MVPHPARAYRGLALFARGAGQTDRVRSRLAQTVAAGQDQTAQAIPPDDWYGYAEAMALLAQ